MTRETEKRIARLIAEAQEVADPTIQKPAEIAPATSEDNLALAFTREHGDDLRYVAAWGRWFKWDGVRWEQESTLLQFDLARTICREASILEKDGLARQITSSKTVAGVVSLARADRRHAATTDQWDVNCWLLNTPGGMIDLTTGELLPHQRSACCTKVTVVPPHGTCPLWHSFLDRIFDSDQELIAFIQRVVGYMLTGSTREHALFFGYGTGANGKGVFTSTISGLLGDYAITAPIETFTASKSERHPTELARLRGARLVTAVETEQGRDWAESRIKMVTGGDPVAARFMKQDFFEYVPQFKLLICGNHKPSLRSVDEAIRRRLYLIPFDQTIPVEQRDKSLPAKLREEWPGILAWAIRGCLEWQRMGLAPPQAVVEATAGYLMAEDALGNWLEEKCQRDETAWTQSSELYRSWKWWCGEKGEEEGSQKRFSQALEDRGFKKDRREYGRGFTGIRLISM